MCVEKMQKATSWTQKYKLFEIHSTRGCVYMAFECAD